MPLTCSKCSRVNPNDALFCYHDGSSLGRLVGQQSPLDSGSQPFVHDFVFSSGRTCRNFDQLALACQEQWPEAIQLLQQGRLESFLVRLGRIDLAFAARVAAQNHQPDRGLDDFLQRLPTQALKPPELHVPTPVLDAGQLSIGKDHNLELRLVNKGMRLLHGWIACEDSFWLSLGQTPGLQRKLFELRTELTIPLHINGKQLRAGIKPIKEELTIESNGGQAKIVVRASVPLTPFPVGVLAGATTPRSMAEKAKKAPKEASLHFSNGAVRRWYELNGWTYPIQGPIPDGLAAVQQFFEALGLTKPPTVKLGTSNVNFFGTVGTRLEHQLRVEAEENRPVYASATSDQPWLLIEPPRCVGRSAVIPLVVPRIPNTPGQVLHAKVTVLANGGQRFDVAVMLAVGAAREEILELELIEDDIPLLELVEEEVPVRRRTESRRRAK